MPIPRRNIRSLQDIRTLSGSVDQVTHPYMAYMRISCLEMEKARRGNERESAMHRVRNIDARFRDIEVEKDALMKMLGERNIVTRTDAPGDKPKSAPSHSTEGFKIRY